MYLISFMVFMLYNLLQIGVCLRSSGATCRLGILLYFCSVYFAIYKPMNMLSQFTREGEKKALSDLEFEFPQDVYPVGRLDADSEGLLILTNDKSLNSKLLDPGNAHKRTYLVQVEGEITNEAIVRLEKGVTIRVKKKDHQTLPAKARIVDEPKWLPERDPPVRYRASIPTSWIELTLTEGKNRQVRRMTASVGFPTLRLIRVSIEGLTIRNVLPDQVIELPKQEMLSKLFG